MHFIWYTLLLSATTSTGLKRKAINNSIVHVYSDNKAYSILFSHQLMWASTAPIHSKRL